MPPHLQVTFLRDPMFVSAHAVSSAPKFPAQSNDTEESGGKPRLEDKMDVGKMDTKVKQLTREIANLKQKIYHEKRKGTSARVSVIQQDRKQLRNKRLDKGLMGVRRASAMVQHVAGKKEDKEALESLVRTLHYLKRGISNLVQNSEFYDHDTEDGGQLVTMDVLKTASREHQDKWKVAVKDLDEKIANLKKLLSVEGDGEESNQSDS
ncbi:hypothetical protein H0H93_002814 [Arthromyces matolae]|nr:hypothetical protein H0H93_002814 [Arthromyces matolae]